MTTTRRPRVAAIGLDSSQVDSIAPLCRQLRAADSLVDYLGSYSWTETDVLVVGNPGRTAVDSSVNVMTIGPTYVFWTDSDPNSFRSDSPHYASTNNKNTERELAVSPGCPDLYKPLASELCRHLGRATEPPDVMAPRGKARRPYLSRLHQASLSPCDSSFPLDRGPLMVRRQDPLHSYSQEPPTSWFGSEPSSATSMSPILFGYHRRHLV